MFIIKIKKTIMDTVRLRTLTEKSILYFGKWEGYSVGQMLDLRHKSYLRWVYYNCSKVSFTDEILKKLSIIHEKEDRTIEKPGTDPDSYEYLQKLILNYNGLTKHIANLKSNKRFRGALKSKERRFPSKSQMQARNHGR